MTEELQSVVEGIVNPNLLLQIVLISAEFEQVADDAFAAKNLIVDNSQVRRKILKGHHLSECFILCSRDQPFDAACNSGQRIVDLVSDSSSKLPDTCEFLVCMNRLFQAPPF